MENNVKLTILCVVYNHKDYIRRTIESFLNQKTEYKYEILIHDDASTDGTIDILKEDVYKRQIYVLLMAHQKE